MADTGLECPASGQEAFRLLTDACLAKKVLGASPLVQTRHGIRYHLAGSAADFHSPLGETHRDQCLCTFADVGIPLDEPVNLASLQLTVRDFLAESIASFSLRQRELSWTAQAYAHYLPPAQSWTDKFGTTTTFSDLLSEVMNRGYVGQSCSGLHVLQTVARVVEADDRNGLLDPAVRSRARGFLNSAVHDLEANQHEAGYWDACWATSGLGVRSDASPDIEERLLVTGHMLEIMHQLRPRPRRKAFTAARQWLIAAITADDFSTQGVSVCTLTHALRAVRASTVELDSGALPELVDPGS